MADSPIVISGGSVTLDFSDKLKPESAPAGKKKYKINEGTLLTVQVNDEKPRTLDPRDKVTITFDDGA